MTHCQLHRLKCSLWDVVGPIHASRSVSVRELLTDLSQHISLRNLLERRYELNEGDASTQASYLLVGSMVLYPAVSHELQPRVIVTHPET